MSRLLCDVGAALAAALLLCGCAGAPVTSPDAPDAATAPDLAAPVGDALPVGAISFFKAQTCPRGWSLYTAAVGRAVVPSVTNAAAGVTTGDPLQSGEDRPHKHAMTGQIQVGSVRFVGIAGEANHGPAEAGARPVSAQTDNIPAGLPYVQFLPCQKSEPPRVAARPLPQGLLLFFAAPACPDGWVQAGPTQGRHLVGLPKGGMPQVSFGGAPLGSREVRTHTHVASGKLNLPAHGIALASGCCADGYAKAGDVSYELSGAGSDAGPPYVQLLQCVKL